jgi:hypothetical protein
VTKGVQRLQSLASRRHVVVGLFVAIGLVVGLAALAASRSDTQTAEPEPAGVGATGGSTASTAPQDTAAANPEPEIAAENGCTSTADDGNGECVDEPAVGSSVSQYGITWTFSSQHPIGQFANGDWWVQGPVTITDITPTYDSGTNQNGWMVNPSTTSGHGFDGEAQDFKASLVPALPFEAAGGQSIVKAVSIPGGCNGKTCLQRAAVLTVVDSVPPSNGATSFRPPYYGTNKPLLSTDDMDANLGMLPRLPSTAAVDANLPSLSAALDNVNKVQLGHIPGWTGDEIHPIDNFGGLADPYGPDVSNINADSFLRMLIVRPGDSETERRQLAIALTQYGIDVYAERAAGVMWSAEGGINLGFKLPLAFAGLILNNRDIKEVVADSPRESFAESGQILPASATHPAVPLWGQPTGSESEYWTDLTDEATRTIADPYAIIDGGAVPGQWYQGCCTALAMKGSALVVRLIPGLSEVWNDDASLEYVDRWVDHGTWTQPDPCAPVSQGGGPEPSRPGECVLDPDLTAGSTFTRYSCQAGKECGRFPELHGSSRNDGEHSSALVGVAWQAFRDW